MNTLQRMTCQCCGAPLDPETLICSYCGTPHRRDEKWPERVFRIETYRQPVETFRAAVNIDDYIVHTDPVKASELAVRQIADCLARSMVHMMHFETERDLFTNSQIVRGTIKVVKPANNAEGITFGNKEE